MRVSYLNLLTFVSLCIFSYTTRINSKGKFMLQIITVYHINLFFQVTGQTNAISKVVNPKTISSYVVLPSTYMYIILSEQTSGIPQIKVQYLYDLRYLPHHRIFQSALGGLGRRKGVRNRDLQRYDVQVQILWCTIHYCLFNDQMKISTITNIITFILIVNRQYTPIFFGKGGMRRKMLKKTYVDTR